MDEKTALAKNLTLILCLALTLGILAVYGQVRDHEFITYDDHEYVVENPHVRYGLSWDGIPWAFASVHASNWHPLTWLSHMLDCELYGLNPSGHHWNNLLLHLVNSMLLFLLLRRLTGAVWRSYLVAALFALHPLHVESVAWVAERKDLLAGFFWILSLWAYAGYAERGGRLGYALGLLLFLAGLLAKPMLVTLPFVFLLLDFWPLGRHYHEKGILLEKVPFFFLSLASSVVTFLVQERWGSVSVQISLSERIANAVLSYALYLVKMALPYPLSFFYPHPLDSIAAFQILGVLLPLAGITYLAFRFSSKIPYLTLGWLWYLGTLVPVIGLVQVGSHAMADRYTYIPLVGPFIVLSWGTADLMRKWIFLKGPMRLLWACWVAILMILSGYQVGTWKDSATLYTHSIRVTHGNPVAHMNLGNVFARQGRLDEAEWHIREALKMKPDYAAAHNNLANVLVRRGRIKEGILHYQEALRIQPDFPQARLNLDLALGKPPQPGKGD
ncbi:MAG: tetratricopeptide repeat protein [Thermodesulfobacteriota bacterium]